MKDDNDFTDETDFFDDVIEDESETYSSEFAELDGFYDEDEDQDDEPSSMRTAVLTKNGMLALLTLRAGASGAQIVRIDPREALPTAQRYDDADTALNWFRRSLATSQRNGWDVVYDGAPLFG